MRLNKVTTLTINLLESSICGVLVSELFSLQAFLDDCELQTLCIDNTYIQDRPCSTRNIGVLTSSCFLQRPDCRCTKTHISTIMSNYGCYD